MPEGTSEGDLEEISGRSKTTLGGCCPRIAHRRADFAAAPAGGGNCVSQTDGRSAAGNGAALPAATLTRNERDRVSSGVRRSQLLHPGVSQVGGNASRRVAIDALFQ